MKVLGISGFEDSVPFKRLHWPGLEEREYRIVQGLDSAAALFVDGELIAAAAEERFSRRKHTGKFPIYAITYCLAEAGISICQIYTVVLSFNSLPIYLPSSLPPIP